MPKKPKVPPPGTDGPDILNGTNRDDTIEGGLDGDEINGKNGDDSLYGDEGDDILSGGNGQDALYGGTENDTLNGGTGKDSLFGDDGDDLLKGGQGKDWLEGGSGDDDLHGGKGKDTFAFGPDFGSDTILDFKDGKEKLDFTATGLALTDLVIDVLGVDATITFGTNVITVAGAAGLIDGSDFLFA